MVRRKLTQKIDIMEGELVDCEGDEALQKSVFVSREELVDIWQRSKALHEDNRRRRYTSMENNMEPNPTKGCT